jgi:hypothetical protein
MADGDMECVSMPEVMRGHGKLEVQQRLKF